MDEPLGALDLKLREQMQSELKRIQRDIGITTIYVTHDQEEALSLSDRVVVMGPGRIAQVDTPERLYDSPANRYVADFVGKINFLPGEVVAISEDVVACRLTGIEAPALVRCPRTRTFEPGQRVMVGIRPEHLRACASDGDPGRLHGRLEKRRFVGNYQFVFVRVAPALALMIADPQRSGVVGKDCTVELDETRAVVFTEDDGTTGFSG
jgi:ABC-type Fe3+/spermidine/putrescine transport system ATPase subunit